MGKHKFYQWQFVSQGAPFELKENELPIPKPGESLIKVAGCGVCHTDISFWHHGVKTKHTLPLTLGHEISGEVIDGDRNWIGKKVIVPAVLPCGECELCDSDRSNICQNQLMPGNDFHGGFASHILVPSKFLCHVPEEALKKYTLQQLSVIADAISTPYQVMEKSELQAGDLAIIIGVGGIGIYGAQIAKIAGAKVLALDVDDKKLNMANEAGADAVLNVKDMDAKTLKGKIREIASFLKAPKYAWKIFEMSGTRQGQETAFGLITYASTLSIVGFTMDKPEIRLSNLMAFDAKVIGTWGCKPELYSKVLELVAQNKLILEPFVQEVRMSAINEVFQDTLLHKYSKRTVLIPDFQ
jgi:6-hydroxycyclohex-1-ene-1-carbonyl-CoA dehydrogenase